MNAHQRRKLLQDAKMELLAANYEAAITLVDMVLFSNRRDVDALCLKGNALALSVLDELRAGLAYEQSMTERRKQAKLLFERALDISPANLNSLRDLADLSRDSGQMHRALELYEQLLNILRPLLSSDDRLLEEFEEIAMERDELIRHNLPPEENL